MKSMNNAHEERRQSLAEKVLCKVGNMFAESVIKPRVCWFGTEYETELPLEIIEEKCKNL